MSRRSPRCLPPEEAGRLAVVSTVMGGLGLDRLGPMFLPVEPVMLVRPRPLVPSDLRMFRVRGFFAMGPPYGKATMQRACLKGRMKAEG